jgi:hypothetical protein
MATHKNAALTPKGRKMMVRAVVDFGLSKAAASRQFNTTPKTVAKWIHRFEAEAWRAYATAARASFIAEPNDAGHLRAGRGFAQAALYRRAGPG